MDDELDDIPTFAKRIKTKYPDYADVEDTELVERMVRKNPVYADRVQMPDGFKLLRTTSGFTTLDDLYEKAGRENNVDPNLLLEQGRRETSFNPDVMYGRRGSSKGAKGSGQFIPATAKRFGVDVSDPKSGINGQARYMRELLDRFDDDADLALAGYNAGEGAVEKYGKKIPPYKETQAYVKNIRGNLSKLSQDLALQALLNPSESPLTPSGKRLMSPTDRLASDTIPVNPTGVPLKTNATVIPPVPIKQPAFKTQAEANAIKQGVKIEDAQKSQAELQKRFDTERINNPSLTTDEFNKLLGAENEDAQVKSKADWLAKNPQYAKFATEESQDPHDPKTIAAYNTRQQQESERTAVRRQKVVSVQNALQGQSQFDFTKTGSLDVPGAMGQAPMSFKYDKANQEALTKGEYRVSDEDGTAYIFTPSTGKFVDEADTQVLETIDLPIPKKGAMTAPIAKRVAGQQIADAIAEKYKLPKQDVTDFFAQYGLSDWETGEDLADEKYFNEFDNPVTGGADTAQTQPFHLTQRTLNQLEFFSQDRQASKATYDEGKNAATASGHDEFESNIIGFKSAKWMSDNDADEELALSRKKRDDLYSGMMQSGPEGETRAPEEALRYTQEALLDIQRKYGSFKAQQAEIDRVAALPAAELYLEAGRQLLATIPRTFGAISKTLGAIDYALSNIGLVGGGLTPGRKDKITDSVFHQAGTEVWDALGDLGKHPVASQAWQSKIADTIGQVAIAAGSAWATGGITLPAIIGSSMGSSQAVDTAIKEGATPNQQLGMGVVGAVATLPDMLLMKGWFKSFTGADRVGLVQKIGQSVYKQLVIKGATAAESSLISKTAMSGFVTRAGQLGQKILFNAEKEVFKPLTVASGAQKVLKGAALEGYQEGGPVLGENDLNLLGKKFIHKPEITFADIAAISDDDIESMKYGAVGGGFGGSIEVATHPGAFKSFKDKRAAYDAINAGMARHTVTSDGKTFTLGDKTFEVTPELTEVINDYQSNSRELDRKLKSLADIRAKANKTKDFAARRELVTEAQQIRQEIGERATERATLASAILTNAVEAGVSIPSIKMGDKIKPISEIKAEVDTLRTVDDIPIVGTEVKPNTKVRVQPIDNSGNFEPIVKEEKPTLQGAELEAAIKQSSEEVAKVTKAEDEALEVERRAEVYETAKQALLLPFIELETAKTPAQKKALKEKMDANYDITYIDENKVEYTESVSGWKRQKELKKQSEALDTLLKCLNG